MQVESATIWQSVLWQLGRESIKRSIDKTLQKGAFVGYLFTHYVGERVTLPTSAVKYCVVSLVIATHSQHIIDLK